MNITQMLEASKTTQSELDTAQDWRTQLDKLKEINKKATEWHSNLNSHGFGGGVVYYWSDDEIAQWWKKVSLQVIYNVPYNNYNNPGTLHPKVLSVKSFNGATITQEQAVTQLEQTVAVDYTARLHVDENWFLNQMLPQSPVQRDPVYTLFKMHIDVPRGELISESLRMLNEKLSAPTPKPNPNIVSISGATISIANPNTHWWTR